MASIYAVERKGGKAWRVQVRKADGTTATQTFPSKSEAKQWAAFVETEAARGRKVATASRGVARFGQLLDAYVSANTEQMGRSKAAGLTLLRKRLGSVKVADMALGSTFTSFVASREKDGAGPATILQDLSYIRTVISNGGTLLGLDVSQALSALSGTRRMLSNTGRVARPKERNRRPTTGELQKLFEYWENNPRQAIPMADIVLFAQCSAMRLSEITSLRWDGLNPEYRTILIRDRKHPRQKKGNDQTVPLLFGPVRHEGVEVDPMEIVTAQRARMPADEPRIFPYDPASISTAFTRACARLGIDDLHFHDLRHDGVSRLFEAGLSIEQVSLVSGHRDWAQLRRYTNAGHTAETCNRDSTALLKH